MSKINLIETATIDELLVTIPEICEELTMVIQSEPGCGKTSLLHGLEAKYGDKYDYIYVDCPVKDMSDVGMTIPDHATQSLRYYVSDLFRLSSPKPKVILLDEFMKSPKLLQVIFTRLMLERMVGDEPLPKGSLVFATSNNASDGVGDSMLAHAGNRVCIVKMQKPNAREWLVWAGENKINRLIRAWVASTPKCLHSYTTGDQDDNELIFNPKKPQMSFVSPRSLAKSSIIVDKREVIGDKMVKVALAGTLGQSAAAQMDAFLSLEKQLPDFEDILKDPDGVKVPDDLAATLMVMFQAVDTVETQDQLSKVMKFIKRVASEEIQAIFFTMLMKTKRTTKIARHNDDVKAWAVNNHELF